MVRKRFPHTKAFPVFDISAVEDEFEHRPLFDDNLRSKMGHDNAERQANLIYFQKIISDFEHEYKDIKVLRPSEEARLFDEVIKDYLQHRSKDKQISSGHFYASISRIQTAIFATIIRHALVDIEGYRRPRRHFEVQPAPRIPPATWGTWRVKRLTLIHIKSPTGIKYDPQFF